MKPLSEEKILDSWQKNAAAWIQAIRRNEIQSRIQVTNQAIIDTILRLKPNSVLDIGCGEGWLVRELSQHGMDVLGVDAIPELIDYAGQSGAGRFKTLAYAQLDKAELQETFDLALANFSLLGEESVTDLFQTLPDLLNPNGYFVVQTLHPLTANGDAPYQDGWRQGSWEGFSDRFCDPAPWYFRTLESWQALFLDNGFELIEQRAPLNPQTNQAASILFVGQNQG